MVVESRGTARTPVDFVPPSAWLTDARVVQLREWGTEVVYHLPSEGLDQVLIGSEPGAYIRIADRDRLVSRKHALLRRASTYWHIKDLDSANGLYQDGERRVSFYVSPGVEIGLGQRVILVPESERLIALRQYLTRVFGWVPDRAPAVDVALRAIRYTMTRRSHLALVGTDDLVPVARQIHQRTLGTSAPFVVCASRTDQDDTSLQIATCNDVDAAFALARGGTICVRASKPPPRFDELQVAASNASAQVQLIVCTQLTKGRSAIPPSPIVVPSLAERSPSDLARIVGGYGLDAVEEFRALKTSFTVEDQSNIVRYAAQSFASIEIATRRLVALHTARSIHSAARDYLRMTHPGLKKWMKKQKFGFRVERG